eukprot:3712559-Rhodomonas_salina.2
MGGGHEGGGIWGSRQKGREKGLRVCVTVTLHTVWRACTGADHVGWGWGSRGEKEVPADGFAEFATDLWDKIKKVGQIYPETRHAQYKSTRESSTRAQFCQECAC